MEKFLGGSPAAVLLRLVILSILVGIVLAALGLQPFDIFTGLKNLIDRLYDMGFEVVEKAFGYLLTGAAIVVPIWLIARLISTGRNK
jgi:hypothetical protein